VTASSPNFNNAAPYRDLDRLMRALEKGKIKPMEQPLRKRLTFLVTVLEAEEGDENLHGRLQVVNSGAIRTFRNIAELDNQIREFLSRPDCNQLFPQVNDRP
jgi:hypothetical protein